MRYLSIAATAALLSMTALSMTAYAQTSAMETPKETLSPTEKDALAQLLQTPEKRAAAIAELKKGLAPSHAPAAPSKDKTRQANAAPGKQPAPTAPAAPKDEKQQCKDQDWFFTLRKDWKDTGYLGCPTPRAKALGAEFSYANDRANQNTIWSVNGTVALTRVWNTENATGWQPFQQAFGTYFTMNRVTNSNAAASSDNADKLAYGLAAEAGYSFADFGTYFRLRGGGVENNLKHASSSNVVFEIMPVIPIGFGRFTYGPIPHIAGLPITVAVEPTIIVQHDAITGGNKTLDFNDRDKSLQAGGQLSLSFGPDAYYVINNKEAPFSRWNANVSYRWTRETYSSRDLTWFTTGATYNLDPLGYFGLGFSYQRGRDVDTGTFTNIYKVSLTGKI